MLLFFWGGVFSGLYVVVIENGSLALPPRALSIAAVCGIFNALALFSFQTGLRYGKIATSWLVIDLSMVVPALLSVLVYREKLTVGRIGGLALVVVSMILLWVDKQKTAGQMTMKKSSSR